MVGVELWAEVRRLHFVRGLTQREIHRRTGLHRDTIRNAIKSDRPPKYERAPAGSKLDPFKDEIHRLLREDPKLPGQRVRELIGEMGFEGGKTIVDDYLREVRPLFAPRRVSDELCVTSWRLVGGRVFVSRGSGLRSGSSARLSARSRCGCVATWRRL